MNSLSSLTPVEVAELLKITKNTVYELIKRGELPSYKVGRKLRIDKEDVDNYINNQKNPKLTRDSLSVTSDLDRAIESDTSILVRSNDNINKEIIISGQDIILDILGRYIENKLHRVKTFRSYIGSYNGLFDLYHNRVSIASSHLWDSETNDYNTPFVKKLLPGTACTLINLAYRQQGFYVQKGNPKNITNWTDLTKPGVVFINREKGSGTRILLDEKLKSLNISNNQINGYNNTQSSHISIASYVARGKADVGIGNEKGALQVNNIEFIPLQNERYDLVIRDEDLSNPIYKSIINIVSSEEFRSELEGIGGYDLKDLGKIISNS
ncbi:helix-turn-helix domain-containing protein [Romboutsia weinsteinii]|uniref:Helix-turn-helix domain-containing protein n=1 Tax=Romboutsia weinsteinii TaxID=2020949 RepID=A0A371J3B1_9FIRM|nr:helix-turn-helix transcriptional regulator [Romboutsia weinsteinii]RDY27164.1 helix-turn-helix domain-containing protein [Romboutsia weinsteinii]